MKTFSEKMKKDTKKSNIKMIAETAGVSIATVSRVFNNHQYVKDEVREKVLSAARELNYSPKMSVGAGNVGIVIEGSRCISLSAYESMLLMHLSSILMSKGYGIKIIPQENLQALKDDFLQVAIGIIFAETTVNKIKERCDTPFVFINNMVTGYPCICSDHKEGMVLGVQHLLEKGHSRIALISRDLDSWGSRERLAGYRTILDSNGIEFDENLIQQAHDDNMVEVVARLLRLNPTAIITCGEDLGLPVSYALNLLQKKVPDDISIISYENNGVSRFLSPAHTTIAQDFECIALHAIETAEQIIKGTLGNKETRLFPNTLIQRDSAGKCLS